MLTQCLSVAASPVCSQPLVLLISFPLSLAICPPLLQTPPPPHAPNEPQTLILGPSVVLSYQLLSKQQSHSTPHQPLKAPAWATPVFT